MDRLLETEHEHENEQIVLGLLSSVETDGARSQHGPRLIAAELGIALGLVNAYLQTLRQEGPRQGPHDVPARAVCLLPDAARLCPRNPG